MLKINAQIAFELEKPYINTLVSGETTRIVVHGCHWTRNGDRFEIEIDGNQQECWNLIAVSQISFLN